MGFLKRGTKVDPHEVGSALAEMGSPLTDGELPRMLLERLPESAKSRAYGVLASLSLLACRRAIESQELMFSPASRQAILNSIILALANEQIETFGKPQDVEVSINEIVDGANVLANVWNENMGREPSPHWHVAKEAWFIICGNSSSPDPACILLLSGRLSGMSTTSIEFLRSSRHLIKTV